jgi:hypothetical protein
VSRLLDAMTVREPDARLSADIEEKLRAADDCLSTGNNSGAREHGLAICSLIGARQSLRTAEQLRGDIVRSVFSRPIGKAPLLSQLTRQVHESVPMARTTPLSPELGRQAYEVYTIMRKACNQGDDALELMVSHCKNHGLSMNWVLDLALGAMLRMDRTTCMNTVDRLYKEISGLYNGLAQVVAMTDRPNALFAKALALLQMDLDKGRQSFSQRLQQVHCLAGSGREAEAGECIDAIYGQNANVKNLRAFVGWLQFMRGHEPAVALRAFRSDEAEGRLDVTLAGLYVTTLSLNGLADEAEERLNVLLDKGYRITNSYALIGWYHDVVLAHAMQTARERFDMARERCPLSPLFQCLDKVLSVASSRGPVPAGRIEALCDDHDHCMDAASFCGGFLFGLYKDPETMKRLYIHDFISGRQSAWGNLVLRVLLANPSSKKERDMVASLNRSLAENYSENLALISRRWLYLSGIRGRDIDRLLGEPMLRDVEQSLAYGPGINRKNEEG